MMKLLFPTEIGYIEQKAAEAEQYRLWAGANVRSDLEAGEALGKLVAGKFMARARTDRAGAAVGTASVWAGMEQDCISRGEQILMELKKKDWLKWWHKFSPILGKLVCWI